jgi:hypothetical protein
LLNLAAATQPSWIACALSDLDALLVDHAHCEKKAAGTALNLIFRYPQHTFLHRPLSALAREELTHFEAVLQRLEARGSGLRAQRPAVYAGRLRKAARAHEPARLLDTLLCCALIEARSCERFQILADALEDRARPASDCASSRRWRPRPWRTPPRCRACTPDPGAARPACGVAPTSTGRSWPLGSRCVHAHAAELAIW